MKADIYWLTAAEGGRITPIIPNYKRNNTYWANTLVDADGDSWSVGVCFCDETPVVPGTSGQYEINFIAKEAFGKYVSGDTLLVCEGSRVVGKGVIV